MRSSPHPKSKQLINKRTETLRNFAFMLPTLRFFNFEAGAWDGLLDAGGFPKASLLPPDYKGPSPEALAGEKTGPGGRIIERFVKQEPPPAAAEIQAPPLFTSPSSIRF